MRVSLWPIGSPTQPLMHKTGGTFSSAANQNLQAERLQMKAPVKPFPLQMKLLLERFFLFNTSSTQQPQPPRAAVRHISISLTRPW